MKAALPSHVQIEYRVLVVASILTLSVCWIGRPAILAAAEASPATAKESKEATKEKDDDDDDSKDVKKEEKKEGYYFSERRYGSFKRAFRVPEGVDADKIEASFDKGVLTIRLPKTPEAQKAEMKIEITTKK